MKRYVVLIVATLTQSLCLIDDGRGDKEYLWLPIEPAQLAGLSSTHIVFQLSLIHI